jgi:protein-L-isoaspartate(D-aspartate) O-methyltransferase
VDDLAAPGRLADELVGSGEPTDWAWKQVFRNVPRHMFVPDWVWVPDQGGYRLIDGGSRRDRHEWLELVYSDQTLVTQLADGADSGRERWAPGPPTSAATQPGLIARMLGQLQAEPGSRVLHLGTGPGYMAALLAARLGDDQVVGVEAEPQLAASARTNLAAAGYQPLVVTGDAADGYPAAAPYDGVLATVPATRIPYPWVSQTRPGGRLVVTAHGALTRHGLAALIVGHDGTARGHYLPHTGGLISLSAQGHPDFGRLLHQTCDAHAGHSQRRSRCSPRRDRATLGAWTVVETVLPEVLATDIPADDGTERLLQKDRPTGQKRSGGSVVPPRRVLGCSPVASLT